ncbi:MAG: DUF559 domain-containing protein [Nocardioides sp.]
MRPPCEFPDQPFTCADAKRLGISRYRLDNALANREIRRVLTGVFVRAEVPDTNGLRALAAALVISPFAVACDRTAAWLHGVDVMDYRELDLLPPLETFVLRGHRRTNRRECRGGSRDLLPEDICVIEGVHATTPLRTALDLGCTLSRRRALAALDAFMRIHGITHADMRRLLPRYFRRRGVVQLRQLVPIADGRAESAGESWTRLEILDACLPAPEPQHWVLVDGRPTYRLDLAYPKARVAVEYDGREFHEADEQRAADDIRRRWLRDQGWTVIVVDKDSFTAEALEAWLGELRTALRVAR